MLNIQKLKIILKIIFMSLIKHKEFGILEYTQQIQLQIINSSVTCFASFTHNRSASLEASHTYIVHKPFSISMLISVSQMPQGLMTTPSWQYKPESYWVTESLSLEFQKALLSNFSMKYSPSSFNWSAFPTSSGTEFERGRMSF